MFGLFGSKKNAKTVTVVHPDVGAALTRAASFPASSGAVPTADYGTCTKVAVDGRPPQAKIVGTAIPGQTSTGYHVKGVPGQPPLIVANIPGAHPSIEIWELASDAATSFAKRRAVKLDPAQDSWIGFLSLGVACLPGKQLLLGVSYTEPEAREALFVYDAGSNAFRKIGRVDPDPEQLKKYFETQPIAADSALVLYYTDSTRLGPENYHNFYNHLLLFSPRYPRGLEILKLGIDDGNIRRWSVIGKTLWLETSDRRKATQPSNFIWSLDLSKII